MSTAIPQRLRRHPWWSARPAWLYLLFVTMILYGAIGLRPSESTPLTPVPLAAVPSPPTTPPRPAGILFHFDAIGPIDQGAWIGLTFMPFVMPVVVSAIPQPALPEATLASWPTEEPQLTPPVAEAPHEEMAQPSADGAVDPAIHEAARALQLMDTAMSNAAQMVSDESSEEGPAVSQR